MPPTTKRHDVVVIGSGFGGLFATQAFKDSHDTRVTLVAKTAHHLFQPLLYQVATGILSEGEIAPATREILRHQRNARTIQGLVTEIDVERQVVVSRFHEKVTETHYDSLIVAAGAGQSYFGNDQFRTYAPGMKSIDDALELRSRIFGAFELAETEEDPEALKRQLTFVVVGAGPTGVEMAGQIRELSTKTLAQDFRRFDPADARVILVDGLPGVLPSFGQKLGGKAARALTDMGIELKLNALVVDVDDTGLVVKHKDASTERIESLCKVWAAGVQGSSLGKTLAEQTGAELDRAGRITVEPDLTLPGHPEIFVVGDMSLVKNVPGVAPAAIQGGRYAAKTIRARLKGESTQPFVYHDKGSMATIAKYNAVASVGKLRISGFIAWVAWLALHLQQLVGFKGRVTTLVSWALTFFFGNGRTQRVTTNQQLVGRLALERLGQGSSGKLLRGDEVEPEVAPREND